VPSSGAATANAQPDQLYLDGIEKLSAGHVDFARATFLDVISRFPDSSAARRARDRLSELDKVHAGSSGVGSSEAPLTKQPAPQPAHASAWEQELQRNASIQAKLRNEVGDRIFFGTGSAQLGTRALAALVAQAQWLKQWPEFEAAIEGHADEPGSSAENVKLSATRAEAVRHALIGEGVGPGRLAIVAWGRAHPIALCSDSACASQNRRVVTLVFARGAHARLGLNSEGPDLPPPGATSLAPEPGSAPAAIPERVGVTR
jgi:outer membrane protein OmpA-like peptidoglycan-associated protein